MNIYKSFHFIIFVYTDQNHYEYYFEGVYFTFKFNVFKTYITIVIHLFVQEYLKEKNFPLFHVLVLKKNNTHLYPLSFHFIRLKNMITIWKTRTSNSSYLQ